MQRLDVKVVDDRITIGDRFEVSLERTLRIPDDGRSYPLPPSLGSFPVQRIADHRDSVPEAWREHGGVFIPMWQREAMWLHFDGAGHKPNAVKVAAGKVDALTGRPFDMALEGGDRQNYMVVPGQPWLDGINSGDGTIRQFCAMPLGMGYTVEGQVTGEERFGGVQLVCFEPRPGRFPDALPQLATDAVALSAAAPPPPGATGASPAASARVRLRAAPAAGAEMGLGAGGRMEQKIYPDPYGVEAWDPARYGRVFIHIVNSAMWREITGRPAPPSPVSADVYTQHGYPWFRLYDEHAGDLAPSETLAGVKSVKEMDAEKGFSPQQDDTTVEVPGEQVTGLKLPGADRETVDDGEW
jgi:hypothetical protein